MWIEWFTPQSFTPIILVVFSTLGVYLAILLFARWSGVRSFAELSTFDIAVGIAYGSLIANTAASKDPPLAQGVAAIAVLFLTQLAVSTLRHRFRPVQAATDSAPIMLMGAGGAMKHANMRIARVTEDDLRTHLRRANAIDLDAVQGVVMEGTGEIHVLHGHSHQLANDSWLLRDVRDHATG